MTDLKTLSRQLSRATSPALRTALKQKIELAALTNMISSCQACPLYETAHNSVPLDGPTHGRADLVFVGEAPGKTEDETGRPFVGRSGAVLDRLLELNGSHRSKVVILNTLAHRPPNNRDPLPDELAACKHWFDRQLAMSGLWIGVALGGYALANIMGVPRSSISIKEFLDTPVWVDGRVWFGTYHPAYALRNPMAKREISLTIRAALALRLTEDSLLPKIGGHLPADQRPAFEKKTFSELDVLGSEKVGVHLHKWGWVLARIPVIDQMVVVLRGDDHPLQKPIPQAMDRYPRWELTELLKLGEKKTRHGWGEREMRTLTMVRDEFGGRVIA